MSRRQRWYLQSIMVIGLCLDLLLLWGPSITGPIDHQTWKTPMGKKCFFLHFCRVLRDAELSTLLICDVCGRCNGVDMPKKSDLLFAVGMDHVSYSHFDTGIVAGMRLHCHASAQFIWQVLFMIHFATCIPSRLIFFCGNIGGNIVVSPVRC